MTHGPTVFAGRFSFVIATAQVSYNVEISL